MPVRNQKNTAVEFSVKHLMIATVKGRFKEVEGTINIDETNPTQSSVSVVIQVASVSTSQLIRDNDLRSDNFFDVEKFPVMTFKSTKVENVRNDRWNITGLLTIKDVTREVVLDTTFEGRGQDERGAERIGFSATTRINRREFELNYNAVLETGGVVVGDEVRIHLQVAGVRV
jgi:polyisoprenoid-binding protein YceI